MTLPPDDPSSGNQPDNLEVTGLDLLNHLIETHSSPSHQNPKLNPKPTRMGEYPPLPPPQLELTVEQLYTIETLRRRLDSEDFRRSQIKLPDGGSITPLQHLSNNFVALARQNMAMRNTIVNLVKSWPVSK